MTRLLAVLAATGAVLVGAVGIGTTAVAVAATDWRPAGETGAPGRLVLDTGPTPLTLPHPTRGADVTWQVRTRVTEPGPVTLDLHLNGVRAVALAPTVGSGPGSAVVPAAVDPAHGVLVSVSTCDRSWRDPSDHPVCDGQASRVVAPVRVADWSGERAVRIPDPDGDGTAHLLVRLSLADPTLGAPASAAVGLGVTARGDGPADQRAVESPAAPGADRIGPTVLAMTGGGFAGPVLVALAALLAGIALRLRGARPRSGS
ncbi:hypothetical protein [Curtobacterium sp. VKM Ac-1376]|uniref:hypothetical protein n=1 Tax=Curtobacterium sp. VKM Ac-1376 TaxID=123312 RepID=UPI00188D4308|nr:hypothetical protein [Curtobacterium sp. VKM Ac-1376]MBF4613008.1 hypothetical protein [Curtobacterium sp. VKM Ac-1376]